VWSLSFDYGVQWLAMGVNVSNLFSSGLWAVLFHAGLAGRCGGVLALLGPSLDNIFGFLLTGVFALYYCFWIQLVSGNVRCRQTLVVRFLLLYDWVVSASFVCLTDRTCSQHSSISCSLVPSPLSRGTECSRASRMQESKSALSL